ncbi:membrane protein [Streptomyces rimosus subsp. rimosus]|nr:membrane protein [Streptomyces rimosus subsp. rimosus]KOT38384.1 membrane protein [Streptomyces sp. NRRL WC-3701]KOT59353.1 membrane protein [Streptomyces rimosus subsp. rimosus]KOT64005.1 membrane protein [Streptomyces rimosus subsp. rimosus]KOT78947.1 membrane protein [Streptomyces rimosus subsp. rimosus]
MCDVTFPAPGTAASQLNGPARPEGATRPAPGPAADEGLARRLRALACTAPLHDLDTRKANLAGEYGVYAMAEVALAAIDLVTLHMDFDTGADHEQIVARLLPRVAAQAPHRPAAEHERVARWVLENLINVGSVDRGFRAVYGTFGPEGEYVRRDYDFKLIEEVPGPGGGVYLRTTDEAVNVLVGALDTDVTSAQIAAEVKLEVLISRGRLADAQLAAEQARYRTVQYAETLRRTLDATRRNVRAVDWLRAVPDMITEALDHVAERYRHENAILTNIRKARDEAEDHEHKRRAAELVDIVKDCIRRHTQLQSRLLEAGPLFRAEQDRQAFAPPAGRSGLDLYGQLVAPVLPLPVEQAIRVTDAFFARGTGFRTGTSVRLGDLVGLLFQPPVEREHLGAEMPEPDLIATPDDSRFSEEQLEAATALLDLPADAPRRLSGLLAEARRSDPDLPYLVALMAVHAASPPVGTAYRQGEQQLLFAVDDGTVLDDPEFGGADLIVGKALLDAAGMAADRSEVA